MSDLHTTLFQGETPFKIPYENIIGRCGTEKTAARAASKRYSQHRRAMPRKNERLKHGSKHAQSRKFEENDISIRNSELHL